MSANASPTSLPLATEELDDHPNALTETVPPPPPCSNTTQLSQTGMVNTRLVCGDDVLAALCHALTNSLENAFPAAPVARSLRNLPYFWSFLDSTLLCSPGGMGPSFTI